jgi:hypothetical protein
MRNAGTKLSVSWAGGDVTVELSISKQNWSKILRGESLAIRGKGYRYEGEFFWDYWYFSGGIDGELIVCFGSPKDGDYSGQGFIGTARVAITAQCPIRIPGTTAAGTF